MVLLPIFSQLANTYYIIIYIVVFLQSVKSCTYLPKFLAKQYFLSDVITTGSVMPNPLATLKQYHSGISYCKVLVWTVVTLICLSHIHLNSLKEGRTHVHAFTHTYLAMRVPQVYRGAK